jgi:hypothetical protein
VSWNRQPEADHLRPGVPSFCPLPGRNLGFPSQVGHYRPVSAGAYDDLIAHLVHSSPLRPGEARRVVAEVLGYFGEPVADFVRRRHGELKRRGLTNDQIFAMLGAEVAARRFAAPPLSARQLRRIVYG